LAFIVSLISDAIVDDLTDALDEVQADPIYQWDYSNLVRIGRLQDDPEDYVNPILVHENDPEDPEGWPHEQYRAPAATGPWQMPRYLLGEIENGGSELYYRRFSVELMLFLTRTGLDRDDAKQVIDLIHGKCIYGLRNSTRLGGLQDEYGEIVINHKNGVTKSYMRLNGGPPNQWIGQGKIWVQLLTQLP
jgi:hypothetical protein